MTTRRDLFIQAAVGGIAAATSVSAQASKRVLGPHTPAHAPDPLFAMPAPVSMTTLAKEAWGAVSAIAVNDYVPGRYTGALTPSPPHADHNPGKAIVIQWKKHPCRFVFSHEASYSPYLELPDGSGMFNQHFEGNLGNAELLNDSGRREKNSFVDIIEAGPERAWVRWTYFAVHKDDDERPRLRGTEDFFSYTNGLVLRRATYQSLMPDDVVGYSTQPVELCGVLPAAAHFRDHMRRDVTQGDYHVISAIDLYSDSKYDIFWDEKGDVRRDGDDATLARIGASRGYALILPFRDRLLFTCMGSASGFPTDRSQLIDQTTPGASGGLGMGQRFWWDHWPIGWINSQGNVYKHGASPYPSHFGSIGHFFVPPGKRIKSFRDDYENLVRDMDLNRWTERRIYYVLMGGAADLTEVRRVGRAWLDKGVDCAKPESIADLASVSP